MKHFLLLAPFLFSYATQAETIPKNIIFMIGDGMGDSQITTYRAYNDNPQTEVLDALVLDSFPFITLEGNPDHKALRLITDPGSTGTALATGEETYLGAISVNRDEVPLETLFEKAKKHGKTVGVAVTSEVTEALPASFMTHSVYLGDHKELAKSYLESPLHPDLILGGGRRHFIDQDQNLLQEFQDKGYTLATNYSEFENLSQTPVLGLFSKERLPLLYENEGPTLQAMTQKSLKLLSNSSHGFVLLVEGSQIGLAGHLNDIQHFFQEMKDFLNAVQVAKNYVDNHPDTLLIVTGTHETVGLALGAQRKGEWEGQLLQNTFFSTQQLSNILPLLPSKQWQYLFGFPLTSESVTQIKSSSPENRENSIKKVINHITNTQFTSPGNYIEIPLYAYGASSDTFLKKVKKRDDIGKTLLNFIE